MSDRTQELAATIDSAALELHRSGYAVVVMLMRPGGGDDRLVALTPETGPEFAKRLRALADAVEGLDGEAYSCDHCDATDGVVFVAEVNSHFCPTCLKAGQVDA